MNASQRSEQPLPIKYEKFIQDIISAELKKTIPGGCSRVIHNKKIAGKSGHKHQIDVFADIDIAEVKVQIAVECKYYSQKVGVDDVLEFSSRIQDISAQKGIIVTTTGFQDGAVKVAKSCGIALVKVGKLALKERSPSWKPVLLTSKLEKSTPGEKFAKWLGEGKPPVHSIEQEARFLDKLNLCQEGALSSDVSGVFFHDTQGEWIVAYSVLGEDSEIIVDRDGLLAVPLLFRDSSIQKSPKLKSILQRLFPLGIRKV